MTPRRHAVALAAILALAAALRLSNIGTGWFGVDQARDLTIAADIAAGRGWPLAGPPMRNRLRLGGLYYGLWVPPLVLGGGARAAYLWAGLLGTVGVALAARLGRRAGGPACGLVAALLLATSPIAVIDERVAWPPAVVPLCTGLILLLALDRFERPSPSRAALLGAVCGLATQVHLSLVPIAALGLGSVLLAREARAGRNLGLATMAFLLPLVPLALVAGERLVAAPSTRIVLPALGDRIVAVLVAPQRAVAAVAREAPAPIAILLMFEALWLPLALVCALSVAWRGARALQRGWSQRPLGAWNLVVAWRDEWALRLAALALLVSVGAVVALPAEAWAYYLDPALLPASVVLGWALTRWRAAAVPWALVVFALARIVVLGWWIGDVAQRGFISTDFGQLALASAAPGHGGHVRLLTLATRQQLWPRLLGRVGGEPGHVAARLHGPGFSDLATDNAYFEATALASTRGVAALESKMHGVGPGDGRGASVSARASVAVPQVPGVGPGGWRQRTARPDAAPDGLPAERDVALFYADGLDLGFLGVVDVEAIGPFVTVVLPARLRPERGRIVACDDRPVSLPWPVAPAPDPRHYGRGEIARPRWPCRRVQVEIPIEGAGAWRLLAAVRGEGRIVAGESRGAGPRTNGDRSRLEPLGPILRGFDRGGDVPAAAVALLLEVDIEGPATLDFVALPALAESSRGKVSPAGRSGGQERDGLGAELPLP